MLYSGNPNAETDGSCEWTPWLNRDQPTATGDYEEFNNHHTEGRVKCKSPSAAKGRVKGTTSLTTTQNIQFGHLIGLECVNSQNPDSTSNPKCWDYEIQFCCPLGNILNTIVFPKMSVNFHINRV